ncbi:MAG TPA: nucleotidyltransferase domain-containing protein [Bryobacteraceae bacterium]|nr:nucleotidyltransferase domain-containing protein [Bryobacteraceae bacterium]
MNRFIETAKALYRDRYSGASVVFAAGSFVRGEATAFSDLDLVVLYPALPHAYRESLIVEGVMVEAFVHDPATLRHYFEAATKKAAAALPSMVREGIELPGPNAVSEAAKRLAETVLAGGPPPLDAEEMAARRYGLTYLIDDLRDPRSPVEAHAAGAQLYELVADFFLRSHGFWSAKGKWIPRAMHRADAPTCEKFLASFEPLFRQADPTAAIAFTEEVLDLAGGPLFDGYRRDVPPEKRKP